MTIRGRFFSPEMTVRKGCSSVSESAANIIFIEKRRSFSASLAMHMHCCSLGRTCNVFLTKMDALRRKPNCEYSLSNYIHVKRTVLLREKIPTKEHFTM